MTEYADRPDLIPLHDNRPLPTALAAVDGRLDDLDLDYLTTIRDVSRCPPEYLRFLAWGSGVDVWRDAWTDAQKRAVIKASPIVKRHKGTKFAVATAVAALGVTAQFVEWWQTAPRGVPYTFEITTWVNSRGEDLTGPLITPELIQDLFSTVNAVKPVSRAFTFRVGAMFTSRAAVGAFANTLQIVYPTRLASPTTDVGMTLCQATFGDALQLALSAGFASASTTAGAAAGALAACKAVQFALCRMEATS